MNFSNLSQLILLATTALTLITNATTAEATSSEPPLLINCGLPKSATETSSVYNRVWQSDLSFAPPDLNKHSSPTNIIGTTEDVPYKIARIFQEPITYTFSLSAGPKFVRLLFSISSTTQNFISPTKSFMSVQANGFTLLQNFNPFLNSPQQEQNPFVRYEFHLILESRTHNLNLTFTPGDFNSTTTTTTANNYTNSSIGYINGIEIVSVPDGLYIKKNKQYKYITYPNIGYTFTNDKALQMAYRLNVGGFSVQEASDSGRMMRVWGEDISFIDGGFYGAQAESPIGSSPKLFYRMIPKYAAPDMVYSTFRTMGDYPRKENLARNLTWRFDVDPTFDYMVRLHFCEMNLNVSGSAGRVFSVYIGDQEAEPAMDVYQVSGGFGVPIYMDYVIYVDGDLNGSKVPLSLALHPLPAREASVLLNGLEIFKVSSLSGKLAVPNPPSTNGATAGQSKTPSKKNSQNLISIILGTIGGALLVSLIVVGWLRLCRRDTSKAQWVHSFKVFNPKEATNGTNPSSIGSSLPSDLCCRFSLTQIRAATSDFNEDLIVGHGGFGKVYKGSINDGAIDVAIKRLNPSSKQGFNEFRTEIEMLTRLRHLHLVSLIGYCEERGEMILVYEYMSRGTLRDHLRYKDSNSQNCTIEPLPWKQRLSICLGSARGLHYLHSSAKETLIHRDVKSTNILLDDKWIAKVSDFGISKVGPANEAGISHVSTAVKGSIGYLDPEYYRRQKLTEKSDVYSFGVVLFEVLCARHVVNPKLPREQVNLAYWARKCYKNDTLHTIIDPCLTGQIAPECLRKFGEIAEMCVRDHSEERPSMGDVVWSLDFALQLQITAEKNNNVEGGSLSRSFGDTENIGNVGDYGATDDDIFTNTSVENFSGTQMGNKYDSGTGTSTSTELKSDSVFSEIRNPLDR